MDSFLADKILNLSLLCLMICSISECSSNKKLNTFFTAKILPSELEANIEVQTFKDYQQNIFDKVKTVLNTAEDKVKSLATKAQESYHTFHVPEHAEKINKYVETLFESDYEENKHKEKIRYSLDHDTHFEQSQLNYDPHKLYSDEAQDSNSTTMYYYNAKCHWGIPEEADSITDWCYVGDSYVKKSEYSNTSAVHIPLDVYKRDSVTLKDIIWTQDMDSSFHEQLCDDDHTTEWSYISTTNGILRYYPGRNWPSDCLKETELDWELSADSEKMRTWATDDGEGDDDDDEDPLGALQACIDESPDIHDARDSSWYVQSLTSPKNVVIMIDNTGSVVGLTLSLIKDTVEYLMNTLTQYDFFNVVSFNEDVNFLYERDGFECRRLIQATPRNKEMIKRLTEDVVAENHSSIHEALQEVFGIMENDTNDYPDTKVVCNPIILILSDGEGPYPQEVLDRMNPEQKTRIFTYSIGKHFFSTGNLRKMACNNRGMFQAIPSNSGTHAASRKYLNVLSKAIAASPEDVDQKWTLPYDDNLGLGRVVSVTRPVVIEEDSSEVVAVVGKDVAYQRLEEHLDTRMDGMGFHTFMTENNGFLFYHPDLKNGFTHEPVAVDMLDLEYGEEEEITEVRKNMINQEEEDGVDITKYTLTEEGNAKYITPAEFTFSFHRLSGYVLTGGFAHPKEMGDNILDAKETKKSDDYDHLELGKLLKPDDSEDITTIIRDLTCEPQEKKLTVGAKILRSVCKINKNYYEKEVNPFISYNTQEEYQQFLDSNCLGEESDEDANLIVYGKLQNDLLAELEQFDQENDQLLDGVHARFVSSGAKPYLHRIKHFGDQTYREEIDTKVGYNDEYIERALMQTMNGITTFSNFTLASGKNMIASAKAVEIKGENVYPLISGVIMDHNETTERIFDYVDQEDIFNCDDDDDCVKCSDQSAECLVLDEAGKLLMTNIEGFQKQINQLVSADSSLMAGLLDDGVYERLEIRDTQGVCIPEVEPSEHNHAAPRLQSIVANLFKIGTWMAAWVNYLTVAITSTTFLPTHASIHGDVAIVPPVLTMSQSKPKPQHCVRKHIVHMLKVENVQKADSDTYQIGNIAGTNLLIVGFTDFNSSSVSFTPQVTETIPTEESCVTEMKRYRRAIAKCQDTSSYSAEDEEIVGCGAVSISLSVLLVTINILALLLSNSLFSS